MPTLLLVLLLSLAHLLHLSPLSMPQRVVRSIVVVQFVDEEEKASLCTGFVVNAAAGEVLTARHCVPASGEVTVDGLDAVVLRTNDAFALLRMPPGIKPPLTIRPARLHIGEPVTAFGYGWGQMLALKRHVALLWPDGDFGLDGPLAHGMSGGPVVDEEGKVVGLNQQSNEVLGIACGPPELQAFLAHRSSPTLAPEK